MIEESMKSNGSIYNQQQNRSNFHQSAFTSTLRSKSMALVGNFLFFVLFITNTIIKSINPFSDPEFSVIWKSSRLVTKNVALSKIFISGVSPSPFFSFSVWVSLSLYVSLCIVKLSIVLFNYRSCGR